MSTAKQPERTPSIVATIPGFANRGSSAIYRTAGWQERAVSEPPVHAEGGCGSVRFQHEEPLLGESAEAALHNSLTGTEGAGNVPRGRTGVDRDMRENSSVTTEVALQYVLTEQPCRAYTKAQRRG